MIGKIIKGKSFKQCLDYVLGKKGAVIVDTNIIGETATQYAEELDSFARQKPNLEKKVCHMILSLPPQEKLQDTSWTELLNQYLEKMQFTNSHYIAVKHSDRNHEHIHIVANRVRLDGSVVSDSWDAIHSQKAIREIEKDFGLTQVHSSWETDRKEKPTGQLVYEAKTGLPLIKSQIADKIDAALVKTKSMPELIAELNANQVRVKISKNRSGKPIGISFNLDNVSVAGSRIGRIYSFLQILKRLENSIVAAERIPQDQNISPLEQNAIAERIPKAIALMEIPAIIRANVKPNMTMPELVDRLKESGVDAHVKYTRTSKVKGISFSVGNESIAGNELGKEYSFNGLQKHLNVSFDAERDNPKLNRKLIDKLKGDGRSPDELHPVEIKPSEEKLAEVAVVTEIKREKSKLPESVVTVLESSTVKPILKTQQSKENELVTKEQACMIGNLCVEAIKVTGKNEYRGNLYNMKFEENTLTLSRVENGQVRDVILEITAPDDIKVNKLTLSDVEIFVEGEKKRQDYNRDQLAKAKAAEEKAEKDRIAEQNQKQQEKQHDFER
jgi:hypothetical protein